MTKLNVDYSQTQLFTYEGRRFWVQFRTEYPSFMFSNKYMKIMFICIPVNQFYYMRFGALGSNLYGKVGVM